jgi:hypothetical protein
MPETMTRLSRSGRAAPRVAIRSLGGARVAPTAAVVLSVAPLALFALALLAAGCLFISSFNHAPSAALTVAAGGDGPASPDGVVTVAAKCTAVQLDASGSRDPDDGDTARLSYEWTVDGQPAWSHSLVRFEQGSDAFARLTLLAARDYVVDVVAIDPRGARSMPAGITLRVGDAPPRARFANTTPAGACGDFAAGTTLRFTAGADDADARCDGMPAEQLTYRWTLTPPAGSTGASIVAPDASSNAAVPPCLPMPGALTLTESAGPMLGDVTACAIPDLAGVYTVNLFADDGAKRSPEE